MYFSIKYHPTFCHCLFAFRHHEGLTKLLMKMCFHKRYKFTFWVKSADHPQRVWKFLLRHSRYFNSILILNCKECLSSIFDKYKPRLIIWCIPLDFILCCISLRLFAVFGYFSPRQTNAGQYVTRGRQCTTAPLPLCKDLHGNTQTRVKYKSKHTQIHEHKSPTSPKNIKSVHNNTRVLCWGEMPGRCWGFALYKEAISSDPSVAGQDLLYLPTNYLWTHSGRRMLDYWLNFSGILLTNWNGGIFL